MASATMTFSSSSSLCAISKFPHRQNPLPLSLSKPHLSFLSSPSSSSLSLQRLSLSPNPISPLVVKYSESETTVVDSQTSPVEVQPELPVSVSTAVIEAKPLSPKREEIFAVVMVGSRQYIVIPGRWIYTQRLKGANVNDKIILNKVLLVGTKNSTYVGKPIVTNAVVHAVVEEQLLDKKVIVFKYKKKKNYRRNIGHRQPITRIKITAITGYEGYPASTLDS